MILAKVHKCGDDVIRNKSDHTKEVKRQFNKTTLYLKLYDYPLQQNIENFQTGINNLKCRSLIS